jgi:malonyl-ACP O-methyltransferase BioC
MVEGTSFLARIHQKFSEATLSYDSHARVQEEAARELAHEILSKSSGRGYYSVLEVGAGTGLLTRKLTAAETFGRFLISDISETMLRVNRRLTGADDRITYQQMDLNEITLEQTFDVITGNMCLQWVIDPERTLRDLLEMLEPGGLLAFSVPVFGSFPEWRKACALADVPFTANPLYGADDWARFVSETDARVSVKTIDSVKTFEHIAAFFHSLKRIGASTATHMEPLQPSAMRRLIRAADKPFTITYKIALIFARK